MAKVIKLKRKAPSQGAAEASQFGDCPECGKHDGYVNVGKSHYFVCHQHKAMWRAKAFQFSSVRRGTR